MGMKMSSNIADICQTVDDYMNDFFAKANRQLAGMGLICVRSVRARSGAESWFDRTGNLRSSIGCMMLENGRVISSSGFDSVSGPQGGGSEGSTEGKRYIEELASKFPTGIVLIVVAGMDYAAYVEDMENKDVLASAELWLKAEIGRMTL